jgi:hypothetical protein
MGWSSRLTGLTGHLKLDVLMTFNVRSGRGVAGLRWSITQPLVSLSDQETRIALVALLYARTLVNHRETRGELFDRMAQAAQRLLQENGGLTFEPWTLRVAGKDFSIWPWALVEPESVTDAKTYTATLQSTAAGSLAIHLKMAIGQERILAPSSALIATSGLAAVLNDSDRARLAGVLLAINAHYRSSDNIGLGSERGALAAAMRALLPHSQVAGSSPPDDRGGIRMSEEESALRPSIAQNEDRVSSRETTLAHAKRISVWVPWYFERGLLTTLTAPLFLLFVYCLVVSALGAVLKVLALVRASHAVFGVLGALAALSVGWIPVIMPPVLYYLLAKNLPGLWLRRDASPRAKALRSAAVLVLLLLGAYLIHHAVVLGIGWIADRDPCAALAAGVTGSRPPTNCR